jgi:hypothetical protein
MFGPGRYQQEAEDLLKGEEADAVLLMVVGGKRAGGMSFSQRLTEQWDIAVAAGFLAKLPKLLRAVADEIDRDIKG